MIKRHRDAVAEEGSALQRAFDTLWRQLGGPPLEKEVKAHLIFPNCNRKFRYDRGYLPLKILIELDGGTWAVAGAKPCSLCGKKQQGGHSTGGGARRDAEKGNLAASDGWFLFRFTTDMVSDPDRFLLPLVELCRNRV